MSGPSDKAAVSQVIGDDCRDEGEPMIREAVETAYPIIRDEVIAEEGNRLSKEITRSLNIQYENARERDRAFVIAERDAQIIAALREQIGEYADRGAMEAADFIERWAKENPE